MKTKARSKPKFNSDQFLNRATLDMVGNFCPSCGSDDECKMIGLGTKGPVMNAYYKCKCGARWGQVYSLRGYKNLKFT